MKISIIMKSGSDLSLHRSPQPLKENSFMMANVRSLIFVQVRVQC